MEGFTMSTLISNIQSVISFVLGTVTDVISTITGNPVLMFAFALPLAGIGITIVRRFLGTRL